MILFVEKYEVTSTFLTVALRWIIAPSQSWRTESDRLKVNAAEIFRVVVHSLGYAHKTHYNWYYLSSDPVCLENVSYRYTVSLYHGLSV